VPFKKQGLGYFGMMEKISGLNWAIAKIIKKIRESKGWTQAQLAGFAGLSDTYIAKLEQGTRGDSVNALIQLAATFGLSPSELMKAIEMELASGPSKPKGTRGRPSQPVKRVREKPSGE